MLKRFVMLYTPTQSSHSHSRLHTYKSHIKQYDANKSVSEHKFTSTSISMSDEILLRNNLRNTSFNFQEQTSLYQDHT